MPRDTDQQIRELAKFKDAQAQTRQRYMEHVVENAYFQDQHNDNPAPLDMLERIAKMDGQGELRAELDRQRPKNRPQRYSYKRETERLFLTNQGVATLQQKYREVYGEEPIPLSAIGDERKKQEYKNGLIEAILDKKLAE